MEGQATGQCYIMFIEVDDLAIGLAGEQTTAMFPEDSKMCQQVARFPLSSQALTRTE